MAPPPAMVSDNDPRSLLRKGAESDAQDDDLVFADWAGGSRSVCKWFLFIGIGLAAYIYSLDGMTTYQYLSYATSSVFDHSFSGTITTVQAIIIAVGKPMMAKVADVVGRGEAFVAVALLYILGYGVIASAETISAIAVGEIFYAFGATGLHILQQIIIADITTLRWRGLVGGLLSAPFILNVFVSAEIASSMLPDWRRGYIMFAIVVPITLVPIICTLLWAQNEARSMLRGQGEPKSRAMEKPLLEAVKDACIEMDFVGLILGASSLILILLPLSVVGKISDEDRRSNMYALAFAGALLFVMFLVYEWTVPEKPVFPMRWLGRGPIASACIIGFFDFMSFYLAYTYLHPFILVTHEWSAKSVTYVLYTHAMSITIFGIVAGFVMFASRRFKSMLFWGLLVRLAGVVLMLRARSQSGSTAELVLSQVLQGLGGGFASVATQVSAQAAVPHQHLATVTAMYLLLSEVGNSVGSAAATGMWNTLLPPALAAHVPTTNQTLLDELFHSVTAIIAYPLDSPIRAGAAAAYESVMVRLVLAAALVALIPPIACAFLTEDVRLRDTQNAAGGAAKGAADDEEAALLPAGAAPSPNYGARAGPEGEGARV